MTFKSDPDTGFPLPDGYWSVILETGVKEDYKYSEATVVGQNYGVLISDVEAEWQKIIPWHRIKEVRNTSSSPEYRHAVELFQLNCDHNFEHLDHHIFQQCPGSVCTKCSLPEPVSEEELHSREH